MPVRKKPNLDIALGIFIATGLIVLIVAVFLIGRERKLFDIRQEFLAHFPNIAGLSVGADVMLSGVVVGYVDKIKFSTTQKDITITMRISRNAVDWIKEDSIAYLDTKGLLGD